MAMECSGNDPVQPNILRTDHAHTPNTNLSEDRFYRPLLFLSLCSDHICKVGSLRSSFRLALGAETPRFRDSSFVNHENAARIFPLKAALKVSAP